MLGLDQFPESAFPIHEDGPPLGGQGVAHPCRPVAFLSSTPFQSSMRAIPNPGKGFGLVTVDAGSVFENRAFFDEGFPFLVVAAEPVVAPFGGINGWNRMDSRFGLAMGFVHDSAISELIVFGFHGFLFS